MTDKDIAFACIPMLIQKNFTINIEDGRAIQFHFKREQFFHLLGLQYLKDMPDISFAKDKNRVIKRLENDKALLTQICKSKYYPLIKDRLNSIDKIADMLLLDKCKVVIDFNKASVPSTKIEAKFLLYKTDEHKTYFMLGIAQALNSTYYPETFFVEPSKYYVNGQTILNCQINYKDFVYKRSGNIQPLTIV